ncbi:MAG: hypothetical protein IT160_02855 [Bryobacterales bacterium]|nr:hypothetical protein [Bryobacterales bacterium]
MQNTTQPAPAAKPAPPPKPVPPPEFREGDIATMDVASLIAIVKDPGATDFHKAKACQRLGEHGSKEAVLALAPLLANERLNTYARHGLETVEDPSADDALLAAMAKLHGDRKIGVINSLGKRRAEKAVPALARLIYGGDLNSACAAASALGHIGRLAAAKELQAALGKSRGAVRTAVADGSLVCAERLLADGKREQALAIYTQLAVPSSPKPVRLAAMQSIIREETSLERPR